MAGHDDARFARDDDDDDDDEARDGRLEGVDRDAVPEVRDDDDDDDDDDDGRADASSRIESIATRRVDRAIETTMRRRSRGPSRRRRSRAWTRDGPRSTGEDARTRDRSWDDRTTTTRTIDEDRTRGLTRNRRRSSAQLQGDDDDDDLRGAPSTNDGEKTTARARG